MSNRIKVGVVFGGKSGEHEVSIQSAKSVMASLDPLRYEVVPIGISKQGQWIAGPKALPTLQAAASRQAFVAADDMADHATGSNALIEHESSEIVPAAVTKEIDVLLPVLHGSFGEDGAIQGMFEMLNLPYVGAGVLASAVGMDKVFMKTVFGANALPQVRFTWCTRNEWEQNRAEVIERIETALPYPCFVKPANLGSSVGISKVKSRDELGPAMEFAAKYDRKIIIEEGLNVREIEVAVLGNDHPQASVPGEVVPSNEFYDYNAKYLDGESALMIPANLPKEVSDEIRSLAVRAFQAIDGSGLGRVDFFIEKETGRILLNEINTMPGFTQYSMYPKLWEATGVSYFQLIDKLIELALERHREKNRNLTEFGTV